MLPAVQCDAAQTDRRGDRHRGPQQICQDPHALESTKLRRTLAGARVFRVAQEDVNPTARTLFHIYAVFRDQQTTAVAQYTPSFVQEGLVVSRMMKHIQK